MADPTCPVCATADIICGKWTILVIRDLAEGRSRFCELERSLAGISPRTLSLRLRALEEQGIVERHTFPEVPAARRVLAHAQGRGARAADRGHAPLRARVARRRRLRRHRPRASTSRPSPPSSAAQEDSHGRRRNRARMRNRALHDALRDFALEAAALLTDELKAGAEVEFDVVDEGGGRGPALYRYEPRTGAFIEERWDAARASCPPAERGLRGAGRRRVRVAAVNGLRGEQAEPALRAMLERLYEDATSFGFPEERFERVYGEVELTLYRDAVRARLIAPLQRRLDGRRAGGARRRPLARARRLDGRARTTARRSCACSSATCPPTTRYPTDGGRASASPRWSTAMRLWAPGGVVLGAPGWRQADQGRWQPLALGTAGDRARRPSGAARRRRAAPPRVLQRDRARPTPRPSRRLGARPLRDGLRAAT